MGKGAAVLMAEVENIRRALSEDDARYVFPYLMSALRDVREMVEEEISNRDGEQSWADWGCGNCEAGTPTPHSLGCRVRNAIFKAEKVSR